MRLLIMLSLLGVMVPCLVQAQVPAGPYIAVQGHAEVKLVPDVFPVDISISDTGMNAAASQELVEGLTRHVMATVGKLHVPDPDIQVSSLHVSPKTKWDRDHETNTFLGNEYERSIRIRLHKLSDVRQLISELPESKNLELRVGGFERSDRAEVMRRLRSEAVADARSEARELANAAGVKVGPIFNISDRPQVAVYARGYSNPIDVASVESTTVFTSDIVLKEGQVTISSDAYLIFGIEGDGAAAR